MKIWLWSYITLLKNFSLKFWGVKKKGNGFFLFHNLTKTSYDFFWANGELVTKTNIMCNCVVKPLMVKYLCQVVLYIIILSFFYDHNNYIWEITFQKPIFVKYLDSWEQYILILCILLLLLLFYCLFIIFLLPFYHFFIILLSPFYHLFITFYHFFIPLLQVLLLIYQQIIFNQLACSI